MKQMQVGIAVVLLVVMVFVVTFAMNYLGGGSRGPVDAKPRLELLFANKVYPTDAFSAVEREDRGTGHQDYWFLNTNDKPVKLGLNVKNCKCTNVEAYVLSAGASRRIVSDVLSIEGSESLAQAVASVNDVASLESEATKVMLDASSDFAVVEPGCLGWIRLNFKGERPGAQSVEAALWMDDPRVGQLATLQLRLMFYEPFRTQTNLSFGVLRDEELTKGVTRYFHCFSPTRSELNLTVVPARPKGKPESDPMVIGKAEKLSEEQRAKLEQMLNKPGNEMRDPVGGRVRSAYRIPITLNAVSADGQTPFDLGPFYRRVLVSSPDVNEEPQSVLIQGRVRGLIEIGADDEGGELNLRSFPRTSGKRDKISLYSEVPDVKLEVDQSRMPSFLKATLAQVEGRPGWTLHVEVLPGMASGPFPRRGDPLYEDCAVYLKASIPGKPDRALRISVSGTATEG